MSDMPSECLIVRNPSFNFSISFLPTKVIVLILHGKMYLSVGLLSNHRLQGIENGKVVFSYKDYGDDGRVKTLTLPAPEFLRRFCLHILPKGFRKIRHYGFLSARNKRKIRELQAKMGILEPEKDVVIYIKPDFKAKRCPRCGKGEMQVIMNFGANAPPSYNEINALKNNMLKQYISLAR